MPRKGDTTDDEAALETGSRVTRSLRRRLNSTDVDESTAVGTPKAAVASKLGSITELDVISVDDDGASHSTPGGGSQPGQVRRTRARASSQLTVENVTALAVGSPARRTTRRSSGAIEPLAVSQLAATTGTGTPGRRTTRRSSMTSDDGSIASSSQQASGTRATTRRSVAARKQIVETLDEEDEPVEEQPPPAAAAVATVASPCKSDVAEVLNISSDGSSAPQSVATAVASPPVPVALFKVDAGRSVRVSMKRLSEMDYTSSPPVAASKTAAASPKSSKSPGLFSDEDDKSSVARAVRVDGATESAASGQPSNDDVKSTHSEPNLAAAPPLPATPRSANTSLSAGAAATAAAAAASPSSGAHTPDRRSSPRLAAVSATPSPATTVQTLLIPNGTPKRSPRVAQIKEEPNRSLDAGEPMEVDESIVVLADEEVAGDSVAISSSVKENNTSTASNSSELAAVAPAAQVPEVRRSSLAVPSNGSGGGGINKSLGGTNNKSVTFVEQPAEVVPAEHHPANSSVEDEEEFHDTCADLSAGSSSAEAVLDGEAVVDVGVEGGRLRVPSAVARVRSPLVMDAGVTPMRKRPNLSLRSSTPLVAATEALADAQVAQGDDEATTKTTTTTTTSTEGTTVVKSLARSLADKRQTIHGSTAVTSPPAAVAPLSRSWSQAVHGTAGQSIDRSACKTLGSVEELVIKAPVAKPKLSDYPDDSADEDDDDEEAEEKDKSNGDTSNSFIDGECEEAPEGEEDSLDSEARREIEENEIPVDGISIGSRDDAEEEEEDDDDDEEMDSFIVSDDDDDGQDDLLEGTGDDLSAGESNKTDASPKKLGATKRRTTKNRIVDTSSSDEAADAKQPEQAASAADEELITEALRIDDEENEANEGGAEAEAEAAEASAADTSSASAASTSLSSSSTGNDSSGKENNTTAKDESEPTTTTHRQVKQLLSRSVHVPTAGAAKSNASGKHNKSLSAATATNERIAFSPFELRQQRRQSLKATVALAAVAEPEAAIDDIEMADVATATESKPTGRKSLNKSAAADNKAADIVDDVEMGDVVAAVDASVKPTPVFKEPPVADILSRCDLILSRANEARRQEKLANKKRLPDDVVEQKKSKKEAALIERARKAAALVEQQKQEVEKLKRKAAKKARRAAAAAEATAAAAAVSEVRTTDDDSQAPTDKSVESEKRKPVNHADILSRCDQMVNKQAEARRQERQLNRREHSDDAVELKRQKKEAALAERARKAAALVEQQRQAEEKRARKADKKERKKAQLTSVVDAASPPKTSIISVKITKAKKSKHNHIPSTSDDADTAAAAAAAVLAHPRPKKTTEYFPVPDIESIFPPARNSRAPTVPEASATQATQTRLTSGSKILKKKKNKVDEAAAAAAEAAAAAASAAAEAAAKPSKKGKKLAQKSASPPPPQQLAAEAKIATIAKKTKKLLKILGASAAEPLSAAATAAADKPAKKKRSVVDAALDRHNASDSLTTSPVTKKFKSTRTEAAAANKTKKRLNILNSSSSDSASTQPPKSKVAAAAPPRDNYKILQVRSLPTPATNIAAKPKKRTRIGHDIAAKRSTPDKPQWTSAGAFVVSKLGVAAAAAGIENNSHHVASSALSDFVVTSLSKKRKLLRHGAGGDVGDLAASSSSAAARASLQVAQFREHAAFDEKRVKRESAKQLLQRKDKQRANARV